MDKNFNRLWRKEVLASSNIESDKYKYGFYVWSNKESLTPRKLKKYICRYVRHPAIANSRIKKCSNEKIHFYYLDRGIKIYVKKSINDFISSLLQHIPPKNFKMIRHYGFYSRNFKG